MPAYNVRRLVARIKVHFLLEGAEIVPSAKRSIQFRTYHKDVVYPSDRHWASSARIDSIRIHAAIGRGNAAITSSKFV